MLDVLRDAGPLSRTRLRERLRVKNARLGQALKALESEGLIHRDDGALWVMLP